MPLDDKNCPSRTIGSWKELMNLADDYMATGIHYAYRGHADASWDLTPSLLRLAPGASAEHLLRLEREATEEFAAQAHLYLGAEHLPQRDELPMVSWWPLMQHFGAPTRLLDWTESPFVGAYFAVGQLPDRDGIIYVMDAPAIQERLQDRYRNVNVSLRDVSPNLFQKDAQPEVLFWSPEALRSARLVSQQGLFTLAENIAASHIRIFEVIEVYAYHPVVPPAARWVIPAALKNDILKRLRTANIAAHSLFPGLDGLGRSIAEVARIGPRIRFIDTVQGRV
jgi:hypothetical protein